MARFRRGRGQSVVVSNKEIIDPVFLLVSAGVTTDINIAQSINNYTGTVGTCPLGAKIRGFYIEASYNLAQVIVGKFDWYLCKRESGRSFPDFPTPGATGGHELRKRIIHERKGVLDGGSASNAGGQTSKSVEFIAIPKFLQRMGESDIWSIRAEGSTNYSFCLKVIYKWFT